MTRAHKKTISLVIQNQKEPQGLLVEAIAALVLCLESEGLTWEAEQAADVVIARYVRGVQ